MLRHNNDYDDEEEEDDDDDDDEEEEEDDKEKRRRFPLPKANMHLCRFSQEEAGRTLIPNSQKDEKINAQYQIFNLPVLKLDELKRQW